MTTKSIGIGSLLRNFEQLVTTPAAPAYNEEWARLQTFATWPFKLPKPADLAKAGLFYAPEPSHADRCECFACGKVFMEWEESDDPLEAHRGNVPHCAFVTGKSNNVPMNSAYGGVKKSTTTTPTHSSQQQQSSSEGGGGAKLSSYLSNLTGGSGGGGGQDESSSNNAGANNNNNNNSITTTGSFTAAAPSSSLLSTPTSKSKPIKAARAQIQYPEPPEFPRNPSLDTSDAGVPTTLAPRTVEDLQPVESGDVGADELVVRLHKSNLKKGGGKRGKTAHVVVLEKETKRRENMDQEHRMEWTALQVLIETSTKVLEEICTRQLLHADSKVSALQAKMEVVTRHAQRLNREDWLEGKKQALGVVLAAVGDAERRKAMVEEELRQLGQRTAVERRDLQRLRNKEELLHEYEEQAKAKESALIDLEQRTQALTKEVGQLSSDRTRLVREQKQNRDEFMDAIDGLKKEKLLLQAELVDTRDALERKKSELEIYDIKLKDWSRREEIALATETELAERELLVAEREREVRAREEMLAKREEELKEALEATRRAKMAGGGRNAVPAGLDGTVIVMMPQSDAAAMWQPEDEEDELERKREELMGMIAQ